MDLARRVMESGGAARPDGFFAEVIGNPRRLRQVRIPDPVPVEIRP